MMMRRSATQRTLSSHRSGVGRRVPRVPTTTTTRRQVPGLFLRRLPVVLVLILVSTTTTTTTFFTHAQQQPFVQVDKFDYRQSFRTSVCDRQRLLWNHSLDLPNALAGLNLTVAITNYHTGTPEDAFFSLNAQHRIPDQAYPGTYAVIMDEVAQRAGFAWRETFAVYPPFDPTTDGNRTWTDILQWATTTFDISMEKWGISSGRMSLGISFPTGWYDSSITLAELFQPQKEERHVDLWSFARPFSDLVWLTIVATIIVTGFLYWVLEYLNVEADDLQLEDKPVASMYYVALAFTGGFELRPNTNSARLLSLSLTFWVLVVVAAYTANMASFLVSPRVYSYRFSTIQDAIKKDATLCTQAGGVIEQLLREKYPTLKCVGKPSEQEIFAGLRLSKEEGGCDAVVHQYNTYKTYKRDQTVNFDCAIASEERIVQPLPAGMATAIDTGRYCTSLISHVLDYHLNEMKADGFIERAWNNHVNRLATVECIREPNNGGGGSDGWDDETFSLGLQDVGGIFILHFALATGAVLLAVYQYYCQPNKTVVADINNKHNDANLPTNRRSSLVDANNFCHDEFMKPAERLVIADER